MRLEIEVGGRVRTVTVERASAASDRFVVTVEGCRHELDVRTRKLQLARLDTSDFFEKDVFLDESRAKPGKAKIFFVVAILRKSHELTERRQRIPPILFEREIERWPVLRDDAPVAIESEPSGRAFGNRTHMVGLSLPLVGCRADYLELPETQH